MTQHPLDAESRQWGSDTRLKLIRLAEMIELAQCSVRRAHVSSITDDKRRSVSPQCRLLARLSHRGVEDRRNDKAADRKSRGFAYSNISSGGFKKLTIVAGTHASFHRLLQPISYPGRLWNIDSAVAAVAESAQNPQVTFSTGSTRVRDRGLRIP